MNHITRKLLSLLPDRLYLDLQYYKNYHCFPNWKSPKLFSEKLQWLKLYDHNPEYVMMVDKYAVKNYVSDKIGSAFIIPTYGVWDKAEDIEWDLLPDKFVLKTTHGGGSNGVVICRDKKSFDKEEAIRTLSIGLRQNSFDYGREWPYKFVPHRIIAEKYIVPAQNEIDLPDYKWFCFNGEPKFCQVIQDRSTNETIDFFDTDWNHQGFIGLNPDAGNASVPPAKPQNLNKQISIARILSKDIPFSRIDLYEIEGDIYFGEITFYPRSGLGRFKPSEYNNIFGDLVTLPNVKK